jgi:hypothetical protein
MMNNVTTKLLAFLLIAFIAGTSLCYGFHQPSMSTTSSLTRTRTSSNAYRMNTVIDAPTKEDLDRKVGRRTGRGGNGNNENDDLLGDSEENIEDAIRKQGPLEYLEDNMEESRDMKDPFHILLLKSTFDKPKITVPYVASNLEYVLTMPIDDATEHSQFCYENGLSCVGVWPREECLKLGRQLQLRDLVCRVVPYAEGGNRAWQSNKDANEENTGGFIESESL